MNQITKKSFEYISFSLFLIFLLVPCCCSGLLEHGAELTTFVHIAYNIAAAHKLLADVKLGDCGPVAMKRKEEGASKDEAGKRQERTVRGMKQMKPDEILHFKRTSMI